MTDQADALEAAIESCRATGAAPHCVQALRELTEWPLAERLTVIAADRALIEQAVDAAFERFTAAVCAARGINWLVWLTAHAMAGLAERAGATAWVDRMARHGPDVERTAARALVFGALLGLDGACQDTLLKCVTGNRFMILRSARCTGALHQRLRNIRPRPRSTEEQADEEPHD